MNDELRMLNAECNTKDNSSLSTQHSSFNTPAIRFAGFGGGISSIKLKEIIISNIYGPRFNANDYDINGNVRTIRGTDISVNGCILYSQVPIASLGINFIQNHILKDGDLIMITTADCGLTGVFEKQKDNYIGSAYAVKITLNQALTFPLYFKYFFQTRLAKNEVNKYIRKATVANLPASAILKIAHRLPDKKEQTKIGNYFQQLDTLIAQHQQKHEKLQNLKKALLEKCFPKQGEHTPELRFKGFSGAWEEKALGDLADIVRGASPRPIENPKWFDKESEIGWLRIKDVSEQNGRIYHLVQRLSQEGEKKTRVLITPHLLLSIAASVGKPVINYVSTGVHDGFLIFLNPKFVQEFMFQWLKGFEKHWHKYGQPGSQVNLNSDIVKNQKIVIPEFSEQTKIGNLFQQLDTLINQQQTQLSKLKNIKQACLEKMFA